MDKSFDEVLKLAFWEALRRSENDVHAMDYPYNDDPAIDGRIPDEVWGHMVTALVELAPALLLVLHD